MSSSSNTLRRPARMPQPESRVVFESAHTVRKKGKAFRIAREVEAMDYVRKNTSVPIPRTLEVHLDDENSWMLMERLPGVELGTAWPQMDEHARSETIAQLKSHLEQIRQLRPPVAAAGRIASVSGGPVWDHRLSNMKTCGLFESVAEFHDFLVAPVKQCPRPERFAEYRSQLADTFDVHYAHADLSWENVLVDASTGRVEGILDWEMAGFWPEWWEFRKALFGARSQIWWMDIMKEVMVPYEAETGLDMDIEMY